MGQAMEPQVLIPIVRQAIEASVFGTEGPNAAEREAARKAEPELDIPTGAFVTIYTDGELRGCLGEIDAHDSVLDVILRCARRVPRSDYRFEPIRPDELDHLSFKVSVMSPLELMDSESAFEIGRDGLYVRYAGQGGLLLPEVPVEYGWTKPEFLRQLWRKARIPATIPFHDVQLYRFTTQVIES